MLGTDVLTLAAFDTVAGLGSLGMDAVVIAGVPVMKGLFVFRQANRSGMEIPWGQTSVQ